MYNQYKNHDVAIYGGYIEDTEELLASASGGVATAIAEQMIDNGGYVAGVSYCKDYYSAEYVLLNKKADLIKLKGSKYIEPHKNHIYLDVKELLERGEQVLFIGLPCSVAVLYKIIGSRPQNLLTCELVCHGPTSQKVHKEYVSYLENKYQSNLIDFSVRHKKHEWNTGYLYAKFSNGKIFEKPFYDTEYGFAFSILGRESCYNCRFKGNNRQGDIMVGDFWGASEKDAYWNKNGVSVIFAETRKGNDFLLRIPNIRIFQADFEKAVESNPMVIKSRPKDSRCKKFSKMLSENGLIYAASHSVSVKEKLVKAVKRTALRRIIAICKKQHFKIKRR